MGNKATVDDKRVEIMAAVSASRFVNSVAGTW